jgi:hypothetical protein
MSARTLRGIVIAAIVVIAAPLTVCAQGITDGPIQVWNPALAASVERLSSASRTFRDALALLGGTGRHALPTTPDTVDEFDRSTLAQAFPLSDARARVETMVVVINLDLLQKLSGLKVTAVDFENDLDRIVAHEIYGHAIPVLLAGSLSANCADPAVGQSAIASCAVQRENVIRAEVGLGRRLEYGRDSLALARRYRHD